MKNTAKSWRKLKLFGVFGPGTIDLTAQMFAFSARFVLRLVFRAWAQPILRPLPVPVVRFGQEWGRMLRHVFHISKLRRQWATIGHYLKALK